MMKQPKQIGIRSLTGAGYISVMSGMFIAPTYLFLAFFSVIHIIIWVEYMRMLKVPSSIKLSYYMAALIGTGLFAWSVYPIPLNPNMQIGILALVIVMLMIIRKQKVFLKWILIGLLWITMPILCLINIHNSTAYASIIASGSIGIACFFICIWVNDTFAYLIGSLIGKTKLSVISKKKTWEGTIGGVVVCVGLTSVIFYYAEWILFPHNIILPIIIGVFATIGDLLESALKRKCNVKDSGSILPGHGGLFDRFDSALLAIIIVQLYLYVIA